MDADTTLGTPTQRLEQKAANDDLKPNSDEQKALDQARKDADKANDLKQQADHAKDAAAGTAPGVPVAISAR